MLLRDDQFRQAYEAVKHELQSQDMDRKVPIFVSTVDCDSVCALRILTAILQSEGIHYSVYPVSGWQEVEEKCRSELLDRTEYTNMFFINCGGTEDLVTMLELDQEKERVFVIDSHRPIHTKNSDEANGQVMVMIDSKDELPPTDLGESDESDSDSSGDGEDSEEEEGDENEPPKQRQRTDESEATTRVAKMRERRRMREEKQRRRLQYYDRGAWRGSPAACLTYELCRQLAKEDNQALWLAIVGLTDQLVHQLINGQDYEKLHHAMEQQVAALGNGEMRDSTDIDDGGPAKIPLNRRIAAIRDYRFTLTKHWTLHDAMLYSPYVATRLQTWREKGRRNLELLLAKMGCSLAQCRQHYGHMRPSIKDNLSAKLEAYAPSYNLPDLQFESFQLEQGFKRAYSASDAVYAISALLEAQHAPDEEESKEYFWKAYSALGENSLADMFKAMELAKKLQKTIIECEPVLLDGGSVMSRRTVLSMSAFRVVNLSDGEVSDRALLSQPLALLRLAMFIQDAYRVMQNKVKPVVVVAPEDADHMCLVVGYTGRPKLTDVHGNRFGNAFGHAREVTKCDMSSDYFDQHAVKVAKSDVYRFIAAVDNGHYMKDD